MFANSKGKACIKTGAAKPTILEKAVPPRKARKYPAQPLGYGTWYAFLTNLFVFFNAAGAIDGSPLRSAKVSYTSNPVGSFEGKRVPRNAANATSLKVDAKFQQATSHKMSTEDLQAAATFIISGAVGGQYRGTEEALHGGWHTNSMYNGKPQYANAANGVLEWENSSNDWGYKSLGTPGKGKWTLKLNGHHWYYNEIDSSTPPQNSWIKRPNFASGNISLTHLQTEHFSAKPAEFRRLQASASYVLGPRGSYDCPAGSTEITDAATCSIAFRWIADNVNPQEGFGTNLNEAYYEDGAAEIGCSFYGRAPELSPNCRNGCPLFKSKKSDWPVANINRICIGQAGGDMVVTTPPQPPTITSMAPTGVCGRISKHRLNQMREKFRKKGLDPITCR